VKTIKKNRMIFTITKTNKKMSFYFKKLQLTTNHSPFVTIKINKLQLNEKHHGVHIHLTKQKKQSHENNQINFKTFISYSNDFSAI